MQSSRYSAYKFHCIMISGLLLLKINGKDLKLKKMGLYEIYELCKSLSKSFIAGDKDGDTHKTSVICLPVTDKRILAQKLKIPKKQFTYQMMHKKKEGNAPGPGKAAV